MMCSENRVTVSGSMFDRKQLSRPSCYGNSVHLKMDCGTCIWLRNCYNVWLSDCCVLNEKEN